MLTPLGAYGIWDFLDFFWIFWIFFGIFPKKCTGFLPSNIPLANDSNIFTMGLLSPRKQPRTQPSKRLWSLSQPMYCIRWRLEKYFSKPCQRLRDLFFASYIQSLPCIYTYAIQYFLIELKSISLLYKRNLWRRDLCLLVKQEKNLFRGKRSGVK